MPYQSPAFKNVAQLHPTPTPPHPALYRIMCALLLQPAKLMARCDTAFKHYSIAASPCGNFVAASGNNGLLRLFRVQRCSLQDAAAQQTAYAAAPAAAKSAVKGSGSSPAGALLPWRFVHEATLLCAAGRETMVNSVRFGSFAGQPRLLVAHQVRFCRHMKRSKFCGSQQHNFVVSSAGGAPGRSCWACEAKRVLWMTAA
jgi:hypothetical protein